MENLKPKQNMRTMTTTNKLVVSDYSVAGLLVFALLAQMPTTAYFFQKIQIYIKPEFPIELNWTLAIFYSLVAEMAMLIWVLKGKEKYSWAYCAVTVFINLSQVFDVWSEMNVWISIGGVFVSLVLPVSIALFSSQFKESIEQNELLSIENKIMENDIKDLQTNEMSDSKPRFEDYDILKDSKSIIILRKKN